MSDKRKYYALESAPFARGGQAEIFKATDKRTGEGEIVAFKRVLNKHDKDAIARLRREITVQSLISHPNVMEILEHSDSHHWYTMPLATRSVRSLSTPIKDQLLLEIIEDSAKGLIAAHEVNSIHRDIKPDNILQINTNNNERWVVSDWGLVRMHGKTTEVRTMPGQSFGTAGFAAPELWINAHDADARADVYSLGRLVYWCIEGKDPLPNVPVAVDGLWRDFVNQTTAQDIRERIKDMNGVLTLVNEIRILNEALPKSERFISHSFDGKCPMCEYTEYIVVNMYDGRSTEIRRCRRCGQEYFYNRIW